MKYLIYLLLLMPFYASAQLGQTDPKGGIVSTLPATTVTTGGGETFLLIDTIPANRLIPNVAYHATIKCLLTTPLINLPTITFKIYYGASSYTTVSGASLLGSVTGGMFVFDVDMIAKTMTSQVVYAETRNVTPNLIQVSLASVVPKGQLTGDASTKLPFRISCTIAGLGSATLTADWVSRPAY